VDASNVIELVKVTANAALPAPTKPTMQQQMFYM
jgi:hypothetical protein